MSRQAESATIEALRSFFTKEVGDVAHEQSVPISAATIEYVGDVLARFSVGDWVKKYIPITTARPTTDIYTPDSKPAVTLTELYYDTQGNIGNSQRLWKLQKMGEHAMRTAGLAPACLRRKQGMLGYFINMGQLAYHTISDSPGVKNPVYGEVAQKFVCLTDILNDIAKSTADTMQLCEHYMETRSPRAARLLEERGIMLLNLDSSMHEPGIRH